MEKITKSTAYSSTINQLPLLNDPRISNDNHLSTLAFYRSTLETANQIREILLEDRLTKLNAENFELLEENGIKRGEILFSSEWAAICPSDRWAYFLGVNEENFDESYGTWTITSMIPAHPEKNK